MRQETIDYFTSPPRNHKISEIIRRGRILYNIGDGHIYSSMEIVYDRIQSGEKIRDLDLVWQVWKTAVVGPESLFLYREKKRNFCERQVENISKAAIRTQEELAQLKLSLVEQFQHRFNTAVAVILFNILLLTMYLVEKYVQ